MNPESQILIVGPVLQCGRARALLSWLSIRLVASAMGSARALPSATMIVYECREIPPAHRQAVAVDGPSLVHATSAVRFVATHFTATHRTGIHRITTHRTGIHHIATHRIATHRIAYRMATHRIVTRRARRKVTHRAHHTATRRTVGRVGREAVVGSPH